MKPNLEKFSKFLSYVLRHQPDSIGIVLDREGWTDIASLLVAANTAGMPLTRDVLDRVVQDSDKQRFAISNDGMAIRANQGHSTQHVDLHFTPCEPPALLYHGTAERFLPAIQAQGLIAGQRHYVHLSADPATAELVGRRHGQPVILAIRAGEMHAKGLTFSQADNGVWLTRHVPPEFFSLTSSITTSSATTSRLPTTSP